MVTGEPFTRIGLPDESNKVTVAPATPVAVPDNVAVPDRVAPHCAVVGAEIVTVAEPGVIDVTLLDESVELPVAPTVIDDTLSPDTGPDPEGHTASAVGVRHNCGESPMTLIVADGAAT
ncbi:MAG: hypothetical protein ACKOA5_13605 [Actinomycetota bacterium]